MNTGCGTYADNIYDLAVTFGIPPADVMQAFQTGLDSKPEAANTINQKFYFSLGLRVRKWPWFGQSFIPDPDCLFIARNFCPGCDISNKQGRKPRYYT